MLKYSGTSLRNTLVGAILLFLFTKKTKLLIIKNILNKIVTFGPHKADINIDIVFIIVFIGVLNIKKTIYPDRKAKDFNITRALYRNIKIAPNSYLIVFYFK